MIMTLLLLTAQAAAHPSEVKSFGDWAVACDNARRCEMTALVPDDATEESKLDAGMSIVREPGPAGGFTVHYDIEGTDKGEHHVLIDGQVIAGGFARNNTLTFTGAKAAEIVAAMVNGKSLTVIDMAGSTMAAASLAGSAAALRFMDAGQGRTGGVTAAVAKGSKPASAVPGAAALPTVTSLRPMGKPAAVSAARLNTLIKQAGCQEDQETVTEAPTVWALTGGRTLVLVPCGAGAYNYSSVPMILQDGKASDARFDQQPGRMGGGSAPDEHPSLVNADFDPKTGRLTAYAKGRGLGDCGDGEEYVWDGTRFLLAEARALNECRGSLNWLTTWRTKVVPK